MAKDKGKLLRTVFSLVLRDPTCKWDKIRSKMNVVRSQEESPIVLQKQSNMMKEDRQAGKYFLSFSQIYFCFSSKWFGGSSQTSALLRQVHEEALHSIQLSRFADTSGEIGWESSQNVSRLGAAHVKLPHYLHFHTFNEPSIVDMHPPLSFQLPAHDVPHW